MDVRALLVDEIRYRPFGAIAAALALAAACACLLCVVAVIAAHDRGAADTAQALRQRAQARMDDLKNQARIFAKQLGFNVMILPAGQDPGRFWSERRSTAFFDRETIASLGGQRFETINHLQPVVQGPVPWPGSAIEASLVGIQGEIYIKNPGKQAPIREAVAPGTIHLGANLAAAAGVGPGEKVTVAGRTLTVAQVTPTQGSIEDVTAVVDLAEAQAILGLEGRVSGVLGLSCLCAGGQIEPIQAEVGPLVPGASFIQFSRLEAARGQARKEVQRAARAELDDLAETHEAMRAVLVAAGSALAGLVALAGAVLVGLLAWLNVRERRAELAILRTIGLRTGHLLALVLGKAVLTGVVGAVAGCTLAVLVAPLIPGVVVETPAAMAIEELLEPRTVLVAALAAITLGLVAALPPALAAAAQDPATILNREG